MPDQLGGVFDSSRPVTLYLTGDMCAALGIADADGTAVEVQAVLLRDAGLLQVDVPVAGGKDRYLLPPTGAYLFARQNFPDQPVPAQPGQG